MADLNFSDFFGASDNTNVDNIFGSDGQNRARTEKNLQTSFFDFIQLFIKASDSIDDKTVQALSDETRKIINKVKPIGRMIYDVIKEHKQFILDNSELMNLTSKTRFAKYSSLISAGFNEQQAFQIMMLDIAKNIDRATNLQKISDNISKNTPKSARS